MTNNDTEKITLIITSFVALIFLIYLGINFYDSLFSYFTIDFIVFLFFIIIIPFIISLILYLKKAKTK